MTSRPKNLLRGAARKARRSLRPFLCSSIAFLMLGQSAALAGIPASGRGRKAGPRESKHEKAEANGKSQSISVQGSEVEAAVVNHAPVLSGRVQGSVRQLSAEDVTLNGTAMATSALLVPGTPQVAVNGHATLRSTVQGTGSAQPSNYTVTLTGGADLGTLITRTDPIQLDVVPAPGAPAGTTDVTVTGPGQVPSDFTKVRDLSLSGNAGNVAVPPGAYRNFTAGGSNSFTFGVQGSTQASNYDLNSLALSGGSSLQIVGPVILTLGSSLTLNGSAGTSTNPLFLTVRIASGDMTLNGGASLYAVAQAPNGSVAINGNSLLQGSVQCNRLAVGGNGTLVGTPGVLQSISPTAGSQGQALAIAILGNNTHWVSGQTLASFGPGIAVGGAAPGTPGPIQVQLSNQATANIIISATASLSPRTVSFTTPVAGFPDGEFETLINAFTVTAVSPPGAASSTVATIAGGGGLAAFADGPGTQARFNNLTAIAIGADDAIYVADAGNNRIRKAQNQSGAWMVSTLAGNGTAGFADGAAASAEFNNPQGVAVDPTGVVYVADTGNNRIRRIGADGTVSTLAGNGTAGLVNGAAAQAEFSSPAGAAVDNQGNIYVADTGNSTVRFISNGSVSSVAGDGTIGSNDSPSAHFNGLIGVGVDGQTAFIYLADTQNERIRRLSPNGAVITLTGADQGFADGSATQARFAEPAGVAIDGAGKIIVADSTNSLIREADPTQVAGGGPNAVFTLAGTGARGLSDGAGNVAKFFTPAGVGVSLSSAIIVADTGNQVLRRIVLPPRIDSFSPAQAPASATITILGQRFNALSAQANVVNFAKAGGGQTQAQVSAATRSQLTVVVPADAATGLVTVQTEGGTATSPVNFVVVPPPPVIADFNPRSGEVGSSVSIFGSLLQVPSGGTVVTFAGNNGARIPALITQLTPAQVQVIVPNSAMTGPINLSTPSGTAATPAAFTVSPGQQDYQVTIAPSSTTVVQGGNATYVVYVTSPLSTFSQLSTLTASGLPAGTSAGFSPQQITAGALSTLTIGAGGLSPGSYSFTITGTALVNGAPLVRNAQANLTVLATGQTTLSGRVLSADDQPILGAAVFLDGQTAITDAAGSFLLSGVNAGQNRPVSIDGRTASAANRTYPLITEPANITAGQANQVPFNFYLPPIDTQYETVVNPNADTVLTNPRVPGLKLTIPAGAHLRNRDGSLVATASVTPLPPDRTPAPLPSDVTAQMVYTAQPGGATSDVPVPVVFPNLGGADPGARVELYAFNHDTVQWFVYGFGDVSADGRTIVPEVNPNTGKSYGLSDFSWFFPSVPLTGDPAEPDNCPIGNQGENPVDYATGNKIEMITDISIGGARGGLELTRMYSTNQTRTSSLPFGPGWNHNYGVRLTGGFSVGGSGRVVMPNEVSGRLSSYVRTDPDGAVVFSSTGTISQLGDVVRKLTDGTFQYRYKHGDLMLFDSTGRLTGLVDRNGNKTVLTYTGGNLTQVTDPVGRSLILAYDSSNRITSATDSIGRVWRYTYEGTPGVAGTPGLTTVTNPLGNVMKYVYVTGGRIGQVIDYRGNVAKSITYDSNGRVATQQFADGGSETYTYLLSGTAVTSTSVTDPLGRVTTVRFNSAGHPISGTDAFGQTSTAQRDITTSLPLLVSGPCGCAEVTNTFDSAGKVLTRTDRLGNTQRFEYEPVYNNLTKYTDKLGRVTTFGYDSNGNLTTLTDALNQTTSFAYDGFGERTTITDPLGHAVRMEYDAAGNQISIVNALGNRSTVVYDSVGRPTSQFDPLSRRVTLGYDALDRIVVTTDPAGAQTSFGYDPNGNLTGATDASNNQWVTAYDVKNRPVSVTDPIGRVSAVQYDADDEVTAAISPSGRTVRFAYDQRGAQASVTDSLGGISAFAYDSKGNLVSLMDPRGNTTTFGYDELYRIISIRDPLGQNSAVVYDPVSNVTAAVDRLGRNIALTYDPLNRVIQATYRDATVLLTYDAGNRLTRIDDTEGGSIQWSYDDANRLSSESTAAGTIQYSRNSADQLVSMTAVGRTLVAYAYDAAGRLASITQGSEAFTYTYDVLSRVTSLQRPNGATTSYTYDTVGRLVRLMHSAASTPAIEDYNYTYDADDEISSISSLFSAPVFPLSKNASTADSANRIAQLGSTSYTFDSLGQRTSKTDAQGTTQYAWDARGRMIGATLPNGQMISYSYDALGRRTSRTANGLTTTFLYDGDDVVLDRSSDGTTLEYLNGIGVDDKLKLTKSGASGPLYFLQDHLGSTIGLADKAGNLVDRTQYEPFGNTTGSSFTRFGYTGRELDGDTNLLYYRSRWYDPQAGQFISEDHAGLDAGPNLREYAADDPVNFSDPFGLLPPSHPYCQRLARTIDNIRQQIAKRVGERHEDKLGLPWRAPGDRLKPSLSRWGHERIINELKALLAAKEAEYSWKCNDPEPEPKCPPVMDNPPEKVLSDNSKKKQPVPFSGPTAEELALQAEAAERRYEVWKWVTIGDAALGAVGVAGAVGGGTAVLGAGRAALRGLKNWAGSSGQSPIPAPAH